jgi:hypothetical protein
MTLRHVICLAMIAVALLTLDVRVAAAQSYPCWARLNACHYGPDGRMHWGMANPSAVSFTTGGSRSSSGEHGWGCGATDGGTAKGRSWGYGNRTAASYRALAECSRKTASGGACHIVSCSASVHSQAEVPLAWFNR